MNDFILFLILVAVLVFGASIHDRVFRIDCVIEGGTLVSNNHLSACKINKDGF